MQASEVLHFHGKSLQCALIKLDLAQVEETTDEWWDGSEGVGGDVELFER